MHKQSVTHVQSCCFAYSTYCSFDVLVAVRVVGSVKSLISYACASLAPVVQTLDSAIQRINHYPADNAIVSRNTYPLDSDLSGG